MTAPTLIARVPVPMTREWSTAWDAEIGLLMIRADVTDARAQVLAAHYAAPGARWLVPDVVTADLAGAAAALVVADPPLLVVAPQTAPALQCLQSPGVGCAHHVPVKQAPPDASRDHGTGPSSYRRAGAADHGEATVWHVAGMAFGAAVSLFILGAAFVAPASSAAEIVHSPAVTVAHTEWRTVNGVCTDITVLSDGSLIPHHTEDIAAAAKNCAPKKGKAHA